VWLVAGLSEIVDLTTKIHMQSKARRKAEVVEVQATGIH
jgi:hypothetical protein